MLVPHGRALPHGGPCCHLLLGLSVMLMLSPPPSSSFESTYEIHNLTWTGGSFEWPCEFTKNIYKSSGRYTSKNLIATRAQIYKDDVIVVFPRYRAGVPVTLAKTSLKDKKCGSTFTAFPCWSLQEEGNCQALQSAVDLFLDSEGILWVLDIGIVNILEQPVRRCPPKIVAFSVKTGKVLKTIDLSGLVCAASRLQYLVVDYDNEGHCFVYVSDAATRAILVYDVGNSRGYRVVLPKAVTQGAARRDVLYLALVTKPSGIAVLIFTYLSGDRMFSIKTQYLQQGTASGRVHDLGPKPNKIVIVGTDDGAAVLFRIEGEGDIYVWNSTTTFTQNNFISVYCPRSCALPTHVMADYKRGIMRVLSSNFQDYIQGTVGCGAIQSLTPL
ncbi:protein yellow-like [Periplaneta americana]|uniref:protein yellow-like n=1 Tax=Periplaneta americana TaxID=6978 RepID=UPI0037E8F960